MPALRPPSSQVRFANWTRWLGPLAGQPDLRGLEIGCLEGESSAWLLQHILTAPSSLLICVDPFPIPQIYDRFLLNTQPYRQRLVVRQGKSQDVLPLLTEPLDLVYVDGNHSPAAVYLDSAYSWQLLKPGGVLIWDDYPLVRPQHGQKPQLAIDAFLACFQGQYELLHQQWQVAIRKK